MTPISSVSTSSVSRLYSSILADSVLMFVVQKVIAAVKTIFAWLLFLCMKEPVPIVVVPSVPTDGVEINTSPPIAIPTELSSSSPSGELVPYAQPLALPILDLQTLPQDDSQLPVFNVSEGVTLRTVFQNIRWIHPEAIPSDVYHHLLNTSHLGGAKASGFDDLSEGSMHSIQPSDKSSNRESFRASQNVKYSIDGGIFTEAPRGNVEVGYLNLPPILFTSLATRIYHVSPVGLLTSREYSEPPAFLFEADVPLDATSSQEIPLEESLSESWAEMSLTMTPEWRETRRAELGFTGHEHLISYLRPAIANDELKDTDPIHFVDGVVKNQSSSQAAQVLHLLLEQTYGFSLALRVAQMDQLLRPDSPPLTWGKMKEVMIGIAAQVRDSDFRALFEKIKDNQIEGMRCVEYIKPEERRAIAEVKRFEDLTPQQVCCLEKAFRMILKNGEEIPMLAAFFPGSKKYPQGFWSTSRFILNARIVQALGHVNALDSTDISLATAEHLGKIASYLMLEEGMVMPLLAFTGQKIYFKVEKVFKKEGLVFQVLAPLTQGQMAEGEMSTLYLNFRGTQAKVSVEEGAASLLRDLNPWGIGANFSDSDSDVTEALRPHMHEGQVLKINGHSLGGVDAQRALVAILEAIERDEISCLERIEVNCFNAPAPEPKINERFKRVLEILESKGKTIPIDITYVRFETDPLQSFGDVFVGAGNTSELVTIQVVTFNSLQIQFLKAHGAIAYNQILKSAEFQQTIINRETPGGLLEKLLSHRYYWNADTSSLVSWTGKVIRWYGSSLGKVMISPFHVMLFNGGKWFYIFVNFFSPDREGGLRRREYVDLGRLSTSS